MSMDDIYVRARELSGALEQFNSRLRTEIGKVEQANREVAPLWEDAMRQEYDRRWLPLQEEIKNYNVHVGPKYMNFLIERLKNLTAYLHGS